MPNMSSQYQIQTTLVKNNVSRPKPVVGLWLLAPCYETTGKKGRYQSCRCKWEGFLKFKTVHKMLICVLDYLISAFGWYVFIF